MYWINLLWCFLIVSFLGWLFSCFYHFIGEGKFYSKGFLTLPFCSTYGAGALICYLIFQPLTDNIFIIFIGSALLLSFFMVISGLIGEKILSCKPWDYSSMRFNIGSFITLPYALLLGVGGVCSVRVIIPAILLFVGMIPEFLSIIISLSIAVLILIDFALSLVTVFRLKKRVNTLINNTKLLSDNIKEEELVELEENYNKIFADSILRKRLVTAFPELKHTAYIKQLKAKLNKLKEENKKQFTAVYENKEDKPFASGLCFSKLFILFVIGSFVGTCIETVYALVTEGHFEFRVGVVYGPFIPVYGGGAVLLTIVLYKMYKLSDTLVFIIGGLLGAFFEYICSWGQETFLGTVSWDYSDYPLNIGGRTCLLFACFWGFLGLIWIRYLYPMASRLIEKIPKKQGSVILLVVFILAIYDGFMTVAAIYRWNQRIEKVPASNVFEEYLDERFDDQRMKLLFPHMRDSESLEELETNSGNAGNAK